VKKLPNIKYYHVVPVQHLTARLAEEGRRNRTGPVASALTALIANSCFPQGPKVTAAIQIKRTVTFLTNDPVAASVFYANLSDHVPVDAITKLAAMLLRCVQSVVRKEKKAKPAGRRKKRSRVTVEEDGEDNDEAADVGEYDELLSVADTALMANFTETICTLWQSIEDALKIPKHEESNNFLIESFSGRALMDTLSYYECQADEFASTGRGKDSSSVEDCYRICAAVLRLAGRLPAKAVEGLIAHVYETLASLPADGGREATNNNVTAHVALLCLWDLTEEVAASLASSIESVFESDHSLHFGSPDASSGKRRSGRRTSNTRSTKNGGKSVVPELPSVVALDVLRSILAGSDPSSVAARQSILTSEAACGKVEKALERGTKYAEAILVPGDNSVSVFVNPSDPFPISGALFSRRLFS